MDALHDVVRAGKARYIGAWSMYAWQFGEIQHVADRHGWTRFVSMQPHYNLLYREEEREMLPLCLAQGVGVIPWSPLARGWLARSRARTGERGGRRAQRRDALRGRGSTGAARGLRRPSSVSPRSASERGLRAAQVALAWLLHKPGVTAPIVGATRLAQLEDVLAAAELTLGSEQIALLEQAYRPQPLATEEPAWGRV